MARGAGGGVRCPSGKLLRPSVDALSNAWEPESVIEVARCNQSRHYLTFSSFVQLVRQVFFALTQLNRKGESIIFAGTLVEHGMQFHNQPIAVVRKKTVRRYAASFLSPYS